MCDAFSDLTTDLVVQSLAINQQIQSKQWPNSSNNIDNDKLSAVKCTMQFVIVIVCFMDYLLVIIDHFDYCHQVCVIGWFNSTIHQHR